MRIKVDIKGADELIKNLGKIGKNPSRRALGKATQAGAEPIVRRQKELAPVDTGRLRDSIRSKFAYRSSSRVTVEISSNMKLDPGKSSWHTHDFYQEFGTSQHPAQPFARPAADEKKELAVEIVRNVMQEAVLEEVRKLGR